MARKKKQKWGEETCRSDCNVCDLLLLLCVGFGLQQNQKLFVAKYQLVLLTLQDLAGHFDTEIENHCFFFARGNHLLVFTDQS